MRNKMAKPNIVDRVVGYFAPGRALSMLRDRTMLSLHTGQGGFQGGRKDRRQTQNWLPGGGSADADLLPQLNDIRARARDLGRNVPIATGAIATNITHVIGDGLQLNAQCNRHILGIAEEAAAEFNRIAEREFALWCRTADLTRVQHFSDMQALLFRGVLESGDIFVVRRYRSEVGEPYSLRLQVIEADRVSNPRHGGDTDTLVAGIEHSADGGPVAVHISAHHPGDIRRRMGEWRRVPIRYNDGRRIVLHLHDRLRPGQTRGIPYFAPVVEALKSLGSYVEAEVQAAVISAMFTVFVTNASDGEQGPLPTTSSGDKNEIELSPGAVIDLATGEDVKFANPNRPNPQFDAFVTSFLRQIGVALELPFELLIKHFTASYSASRAALEMAWHTFRRRRNWLARELLSPVYGWWMEEAVLRGRISAPGFFDDPLIRDAWLGATWTGPVRITLDPKKDAEADEIDLRLQLKTRQQVMTERTGGDFDQKIDQASRERAAMAGGGLLHDAPPAEPATADTADSDEKKEKDQ